LAMGVVVYFLRAQLAGMLGDSVPARLALVGVPALAGVLTYVGLAHVFRLEEIKTVFGMIRRRRKEEA